MSCFALIAMIAAGCDDEDCCSGTTGHSTSLAGPIDCGAASCASGELCVTFYPGIDAGTGGTWPGSCTAMPPLCALEDCYGDECAPCLERLCPELTSVTVSGRQVSCGGA